LWICRRTITTPQSRVNAADRVVRRGGPAADILNHPESDSDMSEAGWRDARSGRTLIAVA
jgi:hypothetical protein